MSGQAVTLTDVAAVSGVSVSTVSRVLNGQGRVAPTTRARIHAAAERLDFRPNALARSFALGRSQTIGLLTHNAPGAFTMPVLVGANTTLGRRDMASLMYDARRDPTALAEHVRKLRARRIDGVLVLGDGPGAPLRSVSDGFSVPVVYTFGMSDDPRDASFLPNSVMAGRLAGQHLIDIGRSRIAHITAGNDLSATERALGLSTVLAESDLTLALGQPLRGNWTRRWGVQAARELLDSGETVDAVFCGDDQIALGVYTVLRNAGVRIPDDIAIVGMDNIEALIGTSTNLLTTIDPNLEALGGSAADFLLQALDGKYEPGVHHQDCSLIIGETTTGSAPDPALDDERFLGL